MPPVPVAERSKERVCGRSLAGVAGSNSAGGTDAYVVCCRRISDIRTEDTKVQNGEKGQNERNKKIYKIKKSRRGHVCLSLVSVVGC